MCSRCFTSLKTLRIRNIPTTTVKKRSIPFAILSPELVATAARTRIKTHREKIKSWVAITFAFNNLYHAIAAKIEPTRMSVKSGPSQVKSKICIKGKIRSVIVARKEASKDPINMYFICFFCVSSCVFTYCLKRNTYPRKKYATTKAA